MLQSTDRPNDDDDVLPPPHGCEHSLKPAIFHSYWSPAAEVAGALGMRTAVFGGAPTWKAI